MKNWNEINNSLSVQIRDCGLFLNLLRSIGCDAERSNGREFRGGCPVHDGDDNNFRISTEGKDVPIYWACYSHQCHLAWKTSLLGLVRGVLSNRANVKVAMGVAVDFLEQLVCGKAQVLRSVRPPAVKQPPRELNLSREEVRGRLVIPSSYFVGRGFSRDILDRFDVGHSARQGKSIVPLYSDDGERCVSFMARSETSGPGPRWTTLEDSPKGSYLYNYASALRSKSQSVILTEGPGDVWKLEEAGHTAVAMLGTDLTHTQRQKLLGLKKHVFLALDNDDAGKKALERICEQLGPMNATMLLVPSQFKDVGEMRVDEVARWLRCENLGLVGD